MHAQDKADAIFLMKLSLKSTGQVKAWMVKCMGFLTITANFQPKEGLSEQLLNP